MYLAYDEYKDAGGNLLTEKDANKYIQYATDAIDALTFNRIVRIGVDNLTEFQKDKVKRCAFWIAEFFCENEDLVKSYVQSYSINGVTASIGGDNLHCESGVVVPSVAYSILAQTGLCHKGVW